MADLTAAGRRALPASQFGLPAQRKYPTDTMGRAQAAKAYASKEEHEGVITPGQKERIDRKADAKLGIKDQDADERGRPRSHALTMASADHLHKHGYIDAGTHQKIRGQAQSKMNAAKAKAPRAFGAMG